MPTDSMWLSNQGRGTAVSLKPVGYDLIRKENLSPYFKLFTCCGTFLMYGLNMMEFF